MGTLLEIGLSNAIVASVLALLAAAGARLLRRPALAHALWLLVLLKLLTPPLITIPLPWPGEPNSAPPAEPLADALGGAAPQVAFADHALPPWPDALALEAVPAQPEPVAAPFAWQAVVATLWLTTSGLWFAWVVLHVYRFRRLLRLARPAPAELQTLASTIATRLGLSRHPAVWLVPGVVS